jgi:hypothetical protein
LQLGIFTRRLQHDFYGPLALDLVTVALKKSAITTWIPTPLWRPVWRMLQEFPAKVLVQNLLGSWEI